MMDVGEEDEEALLQRALEMSMRDFDEAVRNKPTEGESVPQNNTNADTAMEEVEEVMYSI
jgi:hypothetical protein